MGAKEMGYFATVSEDGSPLSIRILSLESYFETLIVEV